MTILHFANRQNDVFLPALLALLLVAVVCTLPVVFAPTLHRAGRLRPVVAVAAVLAVAGVAVAVWQGGIGFRTLADERARVGQELAERYDLALTTAQVGELIDGGVPEIAKQKVRLVPQQPDGDVYDVRVSGRVLQPSA